MNAAYVIARDFVTLIKASYHVKAVAHTEDKLGRGIHYSIMYSSLHSLLNQPDIDKLEYKRLTSYFDYIIQYYNKDLAQDGIDLSIIHFNKSFSMYPKIHIWCFNTVLLLYISRSCKEAKTSDFLLLDLNDPTSIDSAQQWLLTNTDYLNVNH